MRKYLDQLVDSAGILLLVTDCRGQILAANSTWEEVLGWTSVELVGKSLLEICHPEERIELFKQIQSMCGLVHLQHFEFRLKTKNQSWRWIRFSIRPQVEREVLFADCRDITLEKEEMARAKETAVALNEELAFSKLFFEEASVGLNLCEMDGRWVRSNAAFLKMIGYTAEEADGGLTYWQLTPRKYDEMEQVQLKNLAKTGSYGPYEKEFIRKDGQMVPVRLNGFIVERAGKKFIWSIIEDLTKYRSLQDEIRQKVRESETQKLFFETVVENIPVAVYTKNFQEDFKITYWNKAAENIFKVEKERVLGKKFPHFSSRTSEDKSELHWAQDLKAFADGKMVDIPEEILEVGDGTKVALHIRKVPIKIGTDSAPNYLLCIADDITEQKRIAEELKEIEVRAARANSAKMAALGQMAGGVAHEINNPLTVIVGKIDRLKHLTEKGLIDKAHFMEELDKVENTAFRIAKIIQGLRAFSRNSENDPMVCSRLSQIVSDSLELCQAKFLRYGIQVRLKVPEKFDVECRPTQIVQVLINLLNNSFDALENLSEKWVEIEVIRKRHIAIVRVTDSGLGLPPKVVEKLMQPFFTTKEVGKGTGLGLSISKGIIEDHHGRIYYDESSPFTRFVIELPLRQPLAKKQLPTKSNSDWQEPSARPLDN